MSRNFAADKLYARSLESRVAGASPHRLTALLYSEIIRCLKDSIGYIQRAKSFEQAADKLGAGTDTLSVIGAENVKKRGNLLRQAGQMNAERSRLLYKANQILTHLMSVLQDDKFPELAKDFRYLYSFIIGKNLECAKTGDPKFARDALRIAEELLKTWQTIPAKYHYVTAAT
ncbi:flagellar export chaperone FliS [Ferrimonas marina]|uniref:Flagellin-specific chaperone FliS n=1 Tax=Ferrimonas marina TaxID=299255 RepID=A0A1M5TE20_9GAMM|nr:flagellar export chaperone FliS [Ferrimonas marina]SHH48880.1 Flagellin-specific chaperone FliS [Ferrimonas marina]